ncbi:MAG TPA: hypothetical protein VGJ33_09560 [Candidatus Angelobacter sp.]|jgi:hypothetical protein
MKNTTKDNLIYLGVAGTIVFVLAFYIFYSADSLGRIPQIPRPIVWGIFSTPGIVAILFEEFWQHRRCYALWILAGCAALANIFFILISSYFQLQMPLLLLSTGTALCIAVTFIIAKKWVPGLK